MFALRTMFFFIPVSVFAASFAVVSVFAAEAVVPILANLFKKR